jgi:hypothetical protein
MNPKPKNISGILEILEKPSLEPLGFKALLESAESFVSEDKHDVLSAYFCWKLIDVPSAKNFVATTASKILSKNKSLGAEDENPIGVVLGSSYAFNNYILPRVENRKNLFSSLKEEFEAEFADPEFYRQECERADEESKSISNWLLEEYKRENKSTALIKHNSTEKDISYEKIVKVYKSLQENLLLGNYENAVKSCWEHEIVDETVGRYEFMESESFWDLIQNEIPDLRVRKEFSYRLFYKIFISDVSTYHDGPLWGDRVQPHQGEFILAFAASELENEKLLELLKYPQRSEFYSALSVCLLMRQRLVMAARIFAEKCSFSPKFFILMVKMLSNAIPDLGSINEDPREALQILLDLSCNTPLWSSQNGHDQQLRSLHCILGVWLRLGDFEKAWETVEFYNDAANDTVAPNKKTNNHGKSQSDCWMQAATYFFLKGNSEMALATIKDYLIRFA